MVALVFKTVGFAGNSIVGDVDVFSISRRRNGNVVEPVEGSQITDEYGARIIWRRRYEATGARVAEAGIGPGTRCARAFERRRMRAAVG